MMTRAFFNKLALGISALTMAATFINCTPDASSLGIHVEPFHNWQWCADYSGAVVNGYVTAGGNIVTNYNPEDNEIKDGTGCLCLNYWEPAYMMLHASSSYSQGDPVFVADSGYNRVEGLGKFPRDKVHEVARHQCHLNAMKKVTEATGLYPEDIVALDTTCYGDDAYDNEDASDVVHALNDPVYNIPHEFPLCYSSDSMPDGTLMNADKMIPWASPKWGDNNAMRMLATVDAQESTHSTSPASLRELARPIAPSGDAEKAFAVQRDGIQRFLEDPDILKQFGLGLFRPDDSQYFQLSDATGFLSMIGLHPGDELIRADEFELESIREGYLALQRLHNQDHFVLTVRGKDRKMRRIEFRTEQ